jgi:hypothetical protein
MSCNIECNLIKQIKSSQGFAMQVDESIDVASLSVLLAFMRYIYNNQVEEEMLICKPWSAHITADDILNLIDLSMAEKGLSWKQCIDMCTDGT